VSSTVCDQSDADRMLAEIVRVMQPGGRIGIVVRGRHAKKPVVALARSAEAC
jgi:hypothetical protein